VANRYANLVGSNKIKDEWQKINTGFDLVQADMDAKAGADDLVDLENTVNNHIGAGGTAHAAATDQQSGFMSASDKVKLDGIEYGAQVNQNAFAKVNDVEAADPSDELTITGGTGITITTNPNTKEVIVTATGQSTPGPHGSSHTEHGADPIPTATTTEGGLMSADHVQMLESHASRHAVGGADPLTPEMIGAAPEMHAIEHITGGSDVIPDATTTESGLMSAVDKAKLDALSYFKTRQSAPPTTGTYNKGDIIWNNNPSEGDPIGWVCVAAGTPGTWNPIADNYFEMFFSPTLNDGSEVFELNFRDAPAVYLVTVAAGSSGVAGGGTWATNQSVYIVSVQGGFPSTIKETGVTKLHEYGLANGYTIGVTVTGVIGRKINISATNAAGTNRLKVVVKKLGNGIFL